MTTTDISPCQAPSGAKRAAASHSRPTDSHPETAEPRTAGSKRQEEAKESGSIQLFARPRGGKQVRRLRAENRSRTACR